MAFLSFLIYDQMLIALNSEALSLNLLYVSDHEQDFNLSLGLHSHSVNRK